MGQTVQFQCSKRPTSQPSHQHHINIQSCRAEGSISQDDDSLGRYWLASQPKARVSKYSPPTTLCIIPGHEGHLDPSLDCTFTPKGFKSNKQHCLNLDLLTPTWREKSTKMMMVGSRGAPHCINAGRERDGGRDTYEIIIT